MAGMRQMNMRKLRARSVKSSTWPESSPSPRRELKGGMKSSISRGSTTTTTDRHGSSSLSSSSYIEHRGRMMMGGRDPDNLPWCPITTEIPTFFPSVTPLPTETPLPTSTPFPSFTPFPTEDLTIPTTRPTISSRPSVSNAPSPATQTVAPSPVASLVTTSPDGTVTRTVESRLAYGFFAGTNVRQPTQAEIDGLLVETNRFFSDYLPTVYPGVFSTFSSDNTDVTFDANANFPVNLDFDANVVFQGTDASAPTAGEVFASMQAADLQNYIQNYVWNSEPRGTSLFFDTQRSEYGARVN